MCLLDFDLETGDVAIALQMDPTRTISDALGMQGGLDERAMASLVVPYKAHIDCAARADQAVRRGVRLRCAGRARSSQVAAGMYDYVIIDAPPAFTDVILKCFDMADVYILDHAGHAGTEELKVTLDILDNLGSPRTSGRSCSTEAVRGWAYRRRHRATVGVPISWSPVERGGARAPDNEGATVRLEANPGIRWRRRSRNWPTSRADGRGGQGRRPRRSVPCSGG